MDPMVLIGLFFGGGIVFMILFVVVMTIVSKGKPTKAGPDADHRPKAGDAMNIVNNSNNM